MTLHNLSETSLKIEREFAAKREDVFSAWTDPAKMVQWMGPGEVNCGGVDIDLKVGGCYSIQMLTPDNENPIAVGEYKEIVPNEKLQFTWTWKGGEMPDTLVTLTFEDANGNTKLTLLHENFPAKEAAEKHTHGWNGCLDKLGKFVQ